MFPYTIKSPKRKSALKIKTKKGHFIWIALRDQRFFREYSAKKSVRVYNIHSKKEVAAMIVLLISLSANDSLLRYAALGNLEKVKYWVNRGANVNTKDELGRTPLHLAVSGDHPEVVKYLVGVYISRGMINVKFSDRKTLLHFAAYGGDINQVKYLVRKGADVKARDKYGKTPLYMAASKGHLDVVKYLVEKGADVNTRNNMGRTPLHEAARNGNLEVVKYLVERGADINAEYSAGISLGVGNPSGGFGAGLGLADNPVEIRKTPLHEAEKGKHPEVVKYLVGVYISRGMINVKFSDRKTLLHFAAYGGDIDQVKYLVKKGINVNVKDKFGLTPLHEAAKGGNLVVVEYLVKKGADVKTRDKYGRTPCDVARSEEIKKAMNFCR